MEPRWLTARMVRVIHAHAIAAFGGSPGVRDDALLQSAVERPRNRFFYGIDPTLFELAAVLCLGIIGNHPFIDGNKRAGVLAAAAFLDLNGYAFRPDEAELVHVIVAAAAGKADESLLTAWFSDYSTRKKA